MKSRFAEFEGRVDLSVAWALLERSGYRWERQTDRHAKHYRFVRPGHAVIVVVLRAHGMVAHGDLERVKAVVSKNATGEIG